MLSHLKNVGINYDKLKVGCDQSDGRLLVMVGLGIFTTGEHTVISVISKVKLTRPECSVVAKD